MVAECSSYGYLIDSVHHLVRMDNSLLTVSESKHIVWNSAYRKCGPSYRHSHQNEDTHRFVPIHECDLLPFAIRVGGQHAPTLLI